MASKRIWVGGLGLAAGVVGATLMMRPAQGGWLEQTRDITSARQPAVQRETVPTGLFRRKPNACENAAGNVPLEDLPEMVRKRVRPILAKPTIFTQGPAEAFSCCPTIYRWLLDHPNRAVTLWRKIGAKCMDIHDHGNGVFGWADKQGSDVRWFAIQSDRQQQIWLAEGQARVAGVLPLIPVKAVLVLRHGQSRNSAGRILVHHQSDLFLHTDNKTAALITKLMGPAASKMAEQSAGQIQMFFSALAWYLDHNPKRAQRLLKDLLPADSAGWQELRHRAKIGSTSGTTPPATLRKSEE